jgi:hypothetical protein
VHKVNAPRPFEPNIVLIIKRAAGPGGREGTQAVSSARRSFRNKRARGFGEKSFYIAWKFLREFLQSMEISRRFFTEHGNFWSNFYIAWKFFREFLHSMEICEARLNRGLLSGARGVCS